MAENFGYDEEDAVKFIRRTLSPDVNEKYSDDEILFVIDTIWDYYEQKGLTSLDLNVTEDEEVDNSELTEYVRKEVAKDHELMMDPQDIGSIVKGELDYEESLEDFI